MDGLSINRTGCGDLLKVPIGYFPLYKLIHDLVHHDGLPLVDNFGQGQGQSSCPRALEFAMTKLYQNFSLHQDDL